MASRALRAWTLRMVRRRLKEARPLVEGGDGFAVIYASEICASEGVVMPGWLAKEFSRRSQIVLKGEAKSWDGAFGKPWPGVRADGLKAWKASFSKVHMAVWEILERRPKPPIDEALFEEVAKKLSLGTTTVKKLYYGRSPMARASQFRQKAELRGNTRKPK